MAIQPLPSAVVSSLRTDVTVTTSAQCVTELVLNAIDAGATAVAVRVNLPNFQIQVVDNGGGISSSDMRVIGTRYMTSKCNSLQDLQSNLSHFGFRGEALASISDVCGTLTISSRHRDSEHTYCKVFTQGVPHKVGISRQPRASCGTTITISDFLYNRPVRRARVKPILDLEDIKTHLESIALMNYKVSFSLRNNANNEMILQTQKAKDIPAVFGHLFGAENARNLIPVEESYGSFKVEGYISSEAHFLKNLQFIFINQRLLLKTKLHKLVNSLMARSLILKSNNVPLLPISKEISHDVFLAFSPPKRDKHAIFILNILCPFSEYDITLDPKKTLIEFCDWGSLLSCFEQLLRKFIEQEGEDHAGTEICASAPPKKLQTVVDEINQLAREEILNKQGNQSSNEIVHIRAVHSIPVRRDQVNFSPGPSEGISSTTFCGLTSHDGADSAHHLNPIPNSVFTEKPYPSVSHNSHGKHSDSLKPECDLFCSDTGVSMRHKQTVFKSKCFSSTPASDKKAVKGFISNSIHIEENCTNILDGCSARKQKKPPEASPVNALANIKEIRRKKLLNNLDKFSFKASCSKTLLHTVPLSTEISRTSVTVNEVSKSRESIQMCCTDLLPENSKESKAVQTTFSLSAVDSSRSISSQLATCQSSVNLISLENEGDRSAVSSLSVQYNMPQNVAASHSKALKLKVGKDQALRHGNSENNIMGAQSSRCTNPPELHEDGLKFTSEADTQNIWSVEDLFVEGRDRRSEDCTLQEKSRSTWFNTDDDYSNICQQNTKNSSPIKQILSKDPPQNVPSNEPHGRRRECSLDFQFESKLLSKLESNDSTHDSKPKQSLPDAVQDTILVEAGNQRTQRKLVDYDSTPPSSQESFSSTKNSSKLSASSCNFKRKCDSQSEDVLSKRCHMSAETDEPCTFIEGSSAVTSLEDYQSESISVAVTSKDSNPELEISAQRSDENHVCAEENWIRKVDGLGEPFYIHHKSGMTTYRKPNEEKPGVFKMCERFEFLPKGMSPIFKDSTSPSRTSFKDGEDASAIKWGVNEFADKGSFWPLVDQLVLEADKFSESKCQGNQITDATSQDHSQSAVKVYNAIFPHTLSKEIFHKLQVLGQLDNKFIVASSSAESNKKMILLFDQHAVHERIRVESLTNEYRVYDGTAVWKSSPVEPALPLSLSSIEVRILLSYQNKMEDLGFYFSPIDSNTINVLRVPMCLLLRENREVMGRGLSVLRQHLESLIREQVDSLLNTRGVGVAHPSIIQNVISSEACRGAIKFGHPLSVADCEAFLQNLSDCDLPFQCAHGRPSVMPIVDLSQLKSRELLPRPNLQKLKMIQKKT